MSGCIIKAKILNAATKMQSEICVTISDVSFVETRLGINIFVMISGLVTFIHLQRRLFDEVYSIYRKGYCRPSSNAPFSQSNVLSPFKIRNKIISILRKFQLNRRFFFRLRHRRRLE